MLLMLVVYVTYNDILRIIFGFFTDDNRTDS